MVVAADVAAGDVSDPVAPAGVPVGAHGSGGQTVADEVIAAAASVVVAAVVVAAAGHVGAVDVVAVDVAEDVVALGSPVDSGGDVVSWAGVVALDSVGDGADEVVSCGEVVSAAEDAVLLIEGELAVWTGALDSVESPGSRVPAGGCASTTTGLGSGGSGVGGGGRYSVGTSAGGTAVAATDR